MEHDTHGAHGSKNGQYARFGVMLLLSFLAMYVLMYAMVDVLGNALPNLNQFYMVGLMVAPMAIIELLVMGGMYKNKKVNAGLVLISVVALAGFWLGIRQQVAIDDRQFLKSMIPHHAGAILMCEKNTLQDPDLQRLCGEIVSSQRAEIDLMKAKLREQAD